MQEKVFFTFKLTKKRMEDLRILSDKKDLSVALLIREGITMLCQKYKKELSVNGKQY